MGRTRRRWMWSMCVPPAFARDAQDARRAARTPAPLSSPSDTAQKPATGSVEGSRGIVPAPRVTLTASTADGARQLCEELKP